MNQNECWQRNFSKLQQKINQLIDSQRRNANHAPSGKQIKNIAIFIPDSEYMQIIIYLYVYRIYLSYFMLMELELKITIITSSLGKIQMKFLNAHKNNVILENLNYPDLINILIFLLN